MKNIQILVQLPQVKIDGLFSLFAITGQSPNHSQITTEPKFSIKEIPLNPGDSVKPFLTLSPEMFNALADFFAEYNKQQLVNK
jgi:hypothetical protein